MPILHVEIVEAAAGSSLRADLAQRIADAAAAVFQSKPGNVWVRVSVVEAGSYAEDGGGPEGVSPVFVSILKRERPEGADLEAEIASLTRAVAVACGRREDEVHLLYEESAVGRVAFGGRLVK